MTIQPKIAHYADGQLRMWGEGLITEGELRESLRSIGWSPRRIDIAKEEWRRTHQLVKPVPADLGSLIAGGLSDLQDDDTSEDLLFELHSNLGRATELVETHLPVSIRRKYMKRPMPVADVHSPDDQLITKGAELVYQAIDDSLRVHHVLDLMCMRKLEMTVKPSAEDLDNNDKWWEVRQDALDLLIKETLKVNDV